MKKLMITAALMLSVQFAAAAPKATKLPAAVMKEINADAQICRESGGRYSYRNAVQTADLNGDTYPDYIYDASKASCVGGMDLGGSGGWPVTVFAGQPNGTAKEVFVEAAVGAGIIGDRLYLGVRGSLCGQNTRNKVNAEYENCLRPLQWNTRKKAFEFAPVTQKKPFPKSWAR